MRNCLILILSMFILITTTSVEVVADERSTSVVTIEGESYYVHTVTKGETLYSLAKLYAIDEAEITKNNPMVIDGLQQSMVLKIPLIKKEEKLSKRQFRRTFDTHTVNHGETLYSISRRYEIPISTLIEDNEGLSPTELSIGRVLNIRKESKGEASPEQIAEQMEEYRDAINEVTADVTYHLVEGGETIYGISKKYGVKERDILAINDIVGGLKAGAMIIIPGDIELAGGVERRADEKKGTEPEKEKEKEVPLWSWRDQREVEIKDLSDKSVINVSVLLPIEKERGAGNENFLNFYQGVLLGLEDLKAEGISTNLSLFNTSHSKSEIVDIARSREFENSDLIIGPVYEQGLSSVLDFAEKKKIAVVSPLATLENVSSSVLYQLAPDATNKYKKLKKLFDQDVNIIYISSEYPDKELDDEVKPMLPKGYHEVKFARNSIPNFENIIEKRGANIIIVSCVHEFTVDRILATISSLQNNLVARSMADGDIRIVGSSKWSRYHTNIDKNLYFKLKLTYITSYHADRGSFQVKNFDQRFVEAFGALPTLYSYRGYDAAKLFVGATREPGTNYTQKLNSNRKELLQMRYDFVDRGTLPPVIMAELEVQAGAKEVVGENNQQIAEGQVTATSAYDRSYKTSSGNRTADTTQSERNNQYQKEIVPSTPRRQLGYVNNEWALVCYKQNYSIEVQ